MIKKLFYYCYYRFEGIGAIPGFVIGGIIGGIGGSFGGSYVGTLSVDKAYGR